MHCLFLLALEIQRWVRQGPVRRWQKRTAGEWTDRSCRTAAFWQVTGRGQGESIRRLAQAEWRGEQFRRLSVLRTETEGCFCWAPTGCHTLLQTLQILTCLCSQSPSQVELFSGTKGNIGDLIHPNPPLLVAAEEWKSCLTLCNPVDCSPPGSSVYGILQARILQRVAIPLSRGIFLIQGSNPHLPSCRQILYGLSDHGSPTKGKELKFIVWSLFCLLMSPGIQSIREGNGTPLQCSCLENPMDRGAWQAAVLGVAKSRPCWATSLSLFTFMQWRRKWQPTPVF